MDAIPRIDVPDDAWDDVEGDGSRLLATVIVNDVSLHMEAVAVRGDGGLFGWIDAPELDAAYIATGADGGWETALIDGRHYVLHAVPYAA
jgi:hypothetical protein